MRIWWEAYDFKVVYRPVRNNIADALSRLNSVTPILGPRSEFQVMWDTAQMIAMHSTLIALSTQEIQDSKTNPELEVLRKCLDTGDWSACKYLSYLYVKDELCYAGLMLL